MQKQTKKKEICLILHNIRSSHNVGSIFRTADGIGVQKIYLSGYTPIPTDKFGRLNKELSKVALGAEEEIDWEKIEDIFSLVKKLREKNFLIIALEQDEKAEDYKKIKLEKNIAVILGSEVEGVPKEILLHCDAVAEIPMFGKKESLNVSVAAGIFLYELVSR